MIGGRPFFAEKTFCTKPHHLEHSAVVKSKKSTKMSLDTDHSAMKNYLVLFYHFDRHGYVVSKITHLLHENILSLFQILCLCFFNFGKFRGIFKINLYFKLYLKKWKYKKDFRLEEFQSLCSLYGHNNPFPNGVDKVKSHYIHFIQISIIIKNNN